MIALEMAERIFRMFPSSLISADSTEQTAEPLLVINAKEHPEQLPGGAVVVLARLVLGHLASQDIGRYAIREDGPQAADRLVVASIDDAACLDHLHVWRIVGRRTGVLAEDDPGVGVCGHPAANCWGVHWLRSWIGVCEQWAGPEVSLIGANAERRPWYSQVIIWICRAFSSFNVGHSNFWAEHL
jgi:hypothetical protein